jgi:uncharacterized SAM-binding protein YcdF (DUF218 family)
MRRVFIISGVLTGTDTLASKALPNRIKCRHVLLAFFHDMTGSLIATNFISTLLLPPLNLILLCAAGLLIQRRYPRTGLILGLAALAALAVSSTLAGARLFVSAVEADVRPLVSPHGTGAQAIVVLAGGRLANAPEYGNTDLPSYVTLVRIRYAARLYRETGLPLLVTGGSPAGEGESEAAVMARTLLDDYGIPAKWVEEDSDTTAENAAMSAKILAPLGLRRILLVTDAMHMPRSELIFARNGFDVVPAPTIFLSHDRITPLSFLPGGEGMRRMHYAWHERIGILWYRMRHADVAVSGGSAVAKE